MKTGTLIRLKGSKNAPMIFVIPPGRQTSGREKTFWKRGKKDKSMPPVKKISIVKNNIARTGLQGWHNLKR